jgi:hypothetical protein
MGRRYEGNDGIVTNVCVTVTSGAQHCVTVEGMLRGALLVAVLAGAGACAGETAAVRQPARPRSGLTVLLQRGALASAAETIGGTTVAGVADAGDGLPDGLRPGAARRHAARALPVVPAGEVAFAPLRSGGHLVEVAIGDFSAPLVVTADGGPGGSPEVLLEGSNVKILVQLPPSALREVTSGPALLPASTKPSAAAVRLAAGLPVERLGRAGETGALGWIRYRDKKVEAVGVVDPARVGRTYASSGAAEPTAGDAEVSTPLVLLDQPSGRPFATIWRDAGPVLPALRLQTANGWTLVRIDVSDDVSLTGWVRTLRVEASATSARTSRPAHARGQWLSVAGMRERDVRCVELARSTRLRERPDGRVSGLVTRDDRFVLLGHRGHWLQVGVGHPFGLARLWVPDHQLRPVSCGPTGGQLGSN